MVTAEDESTPIQSGGAGQSVLARNRDDKTLPKPFAARMAQPGANPRSGKYFTLGLKEGFSQWWQSLSPAAAEHGVLSHIPNLQKPPAPATSGSQQSSSAPVSATQSSTSLGSKEQITKDDPYGPRKWATEMVKLSGKDRELNEFSITRLADEPSQSRHDLVMLHGYGAGLAFFYKNFEALTRRPGWRLFALDLPGMGRSSRPPFRLHAKDREGKIEEAESWFVDALEEWRIKRKLERFTLLGHSLGGYMAVAYALKYPGRLEKLILASPVGIPEDPYAVNADMPDSKSPALTKTITEDVAEGANVGAAPPAEGDESVKDQNNFLNARKDSPNEGNFGGPAAPTGRTRPYPKWLVYLWDANVSPFSIVRWAGPLGPRFVSGWTSRRFSHLPPEEAESLHTYSYSLFRQRGSGEYALAHILAPGAFARSPLIRRIGEVGRGVISDPPAPAASNGSVDTAAPKTTEPAVPASTTTPPLAQISEQQQQQQQREHGIPVVFMYGEHDWMDVNGGRAAAKKIKEAHARAVEGKSASEAENDKGAARVYVIGGAGHHVYLDGPEDFNEAMEKELEETDSGKKL